MKIKIVSIEKNAATAKNGKPYEVIEVAYKNLTFNGKMESRKIMPFGSTADTAHMLSKASAGELYEITVVKNTAGYNDWTACTPIDEAPATLPVQASYPAPGPVSKSPSGNSYPTAEERAKTQVYIVRQSSINQALEYLKLTGTDMDRIPEVTDVLEIAKKFEQHVFSVAQPKSLFDMENDLPPVEVYDDIPS